MRLLGSRQIKRELQPSVAGNGSVDADQKIFERHTLPLANVTESRNTNALRGSCVP
jgi:hypothetical protein